mmetsp:Transcript_58440/g.128387  ORF Transcript_58440/g.128387 Transcript_58440/m.128387 type:complete len:208 (-) Transcript_58440:69-692(-)
MDRNRQQAAYQGSRLVRLCMVMAPSSSFLSVLSLSSSSSPPRVASSGERMWLSQTPASFELSIGLRPDVAVAAAAAAVVDDDDVVVVVDVEPLVCGTVAGRSVEKRQAVEHSSGMSTQQSHCQQSRQSRFGPVRTQFPEMCVPWPRRVAVVAPAAAAAAAVAACGVQQPQRQHQQRIVVFRNLASRPELQKQVALGAMAFAARAGAR